VLLPLRSAPGGQLHGVIFCGQAQTVKSRLIEANKKTKASLVTKTEKDILAVAEVIQEFCKANGHILDALVEARKHSVEPGDIVKKAIDSMRTRYREHIDLSAIAKTVSLSPSRLAHLLKDHTGKSFTQNLRSIRMAEAHQLLSSTDLKVHSIAMMVGFDDPGYFRRLFKRLYSETPQEFRARIRFSAQQNK
jgi:YesN/AraC family two-component response regulator